MSWITRVILKAATWTCLVVAIGLSGCGKDYGGTICYGVEPPLNQPDVDGDGWLDTDDAFPDDPTRH